MKRLFAALFALAVLALPGCTKDVSQSDGRITVAVGIVPAGAFVDKVSGGLVEVVAMIPPGNSPENYEVSSSQMMQLSRAKLYFTLQMPTEQASILPKAKDFGSDIEIVDLRMIVGQQYPFVKSAHQHHQDEEHEDGEDHGAHEDHEDAHDEDGDEAFEIDPHIWLSPKRVIVMVRAIADKLSEIDPANAEMYAANAEAYIGELEALDHQIREITGKIENKKFLIYHPAYAYFADDYGLEMIAIEARGKQATASELQQVIDMAKQNHITTVFYQAEFDDRQAQTVADEIGGCVEKVSPLSYDYIESLIAVAQALANS